jgi:RNA recognition motif-containing protein
VGRRFVGPVGPAGEKIGNGLEDKDLEEAFEKFGRLEDAKIINDRKSGMSRGFGFVTFDSPVAAADAARLARHTIDSKSVEAKLAIPRNAAPRPIRNQLPQEPFQAAQNFPFMGQERGGARVQSSNRKIFVGGLVDVTNDMLREHFSHVS